MADETSRRIESLLLKILERVKSIEHVVKRKPNHISLGFPTLTRKDDGTVANFELANDMVASIPILVDDAAGDPVPAPSGDVFSAVATGPAGSTPDGLQVAVDGSNNLVLTPTVRVSPGWSVTVSDSSGLAAFTLPVDIVEDTTPKAITLDVAAATEVAQPVPTAPGP